MKGRAIPYSIVAGVENAPLPPQMRADEIVLNAWAARDLNARIGDHVTLRYFVMGAGRRLEAKSASFRLRAVVPIAGAACDLALMPDFPGIAGAETAATGSRVLMSIWRKFAHKMKPTGTLIAARPKPLCASIGTRVVAKPPR